MKVHFSVNLYDKDGDKYEDGIYLHLENGTILRMKDMNELDQFIKNLETIKDEIEDK